ncbi:MAG: glycosyltransferase [Lachnospiraceae bacterium]|nr:glycosyltransferase [Lachnospiraceae bacterium]
MSRFQYKMTVIVPSYNNGQYIRQALDSILMQKVDFRYQVIITDDCSQDDSQDIIKENELKYPDKILALYSDKNCRLFQNVLKALKRMDSEYFCVLDPDDYWSDDRRLQKAVDFLDKNPDYTIYGTNAYKLYNDGTVELYYNRPKIKDYTSTYEDFLMEKSVLSNTFASTYRNIYFSNGVPEEYANIVGSKFEESFRADSARNLIHLKRGKAYFLNESIGYSRRHGKGLASCLKEYERYITAAFAHIGFFEFFGKEHKKHYEKMIRKLYTAAVKAYYQEIVSEKIPIMPEMVRAYFCTVMEWLQTHQSQNLDVRIPFSLQKFSEAIQGKVIIWGTGNAASRIIGQYGIPIHPDTIFVDNDMRRQGKEFMGKIVQSPDVIQGRTDAFVVIASSYDKEIIKQIREQGLCPIDRIINIYDYERVFVS